MARDPLADRRFRLIVWTLVAVVGWAGLAFIVATLWNAEPRAAGFDWQLIIDAGRRVAAGESPYDPALLAAPVDLRAVDLFYSYPPPVAQAAALLAEVPPLASFLALDAIAVAGTGLVVVALARTRPNVAPADLLVAVLAILPLLFPVTVALAFGNVDVLYPLLYGAVLVGVIATGSGRRSAIGGGIAIALAAIAKIGPGAVGLWLAVRGARERVTGEPARSWTILVTAIVTGLAVLAVSLVAGGDGPWRDYMRVLGVASSADVLVGQNIAPATQVALAAGLDGDAARILYVLVLFATVALIVGAAAGVEDTLTSLAIGAACSLVVLPIAWYHYPPALLPFAVAAVVRAIGSPALGRVLRLVAAAGIVASLAIALPVAVWVSVVLVVVAADVSQPRRVALGVPAPRPGPAS